MLRIAPFLLVLVVACTGASRPSEPDPPATLSIQTDGTIVDLAVELADTPDERATGLMHRQDLAPFDGMAFVWSAPVRTSFWMKDTLIPLSIAFWDDRGRIVSMLDMEPCESDPCPSYDPGVEFVGAVEVRQGLLVARGVEVGDRVELEVSSG